jgi:hypothetical protein
MKLSPSEQESITQLLTRIYLDICALETEHGLLAGDGDLRPRIEYFHDAIRAHSSGDVAHREVGGRLCVEILAYDLACLRFLQSKPLAPFNPHAQALSPGTALTVSGTGAAIATTKSDRATKRRISELYQNYAMLYAALLKPIADRDYQERTDDINQDIDDLHALLHKEKNPKNIAEIKRKIASLDKNAKSVDAAHMDYAIHQLGIYESSKDTLKKMAAQGMNLVGKFVEASIATTRKQVSR